MALAFDSGDRINAPGSGGTTVSAVACWIKTNAGTGSGTSFLTKNDGLTNSRRGFTFYVATDGRIRFIIIREVGEVQFDIGGSGANLATNTWQHISANIDYTTTANGNEIYHNGALIQQGTCSASVSSVSTVMRCGDGVDSFFDNFVGELAEVGVWSRKLTAAEHAALAKGFRPPAIATNELMSYVPMIRESIDPVDGSTTDPVGVAASTHPRVIG